MWEAFGTKLNQVALKLLPPYVCRLWRQGVFDEGLAHRIEAGANMFLMRAAESSCVKLMDHFQGRPMREHRLEQGESI